MNQIGLKKNQYRGKLANRAKKLTRFTRLYAVEMFFRERDVAIVPVYDR